jgi:hypothetical protein
MSRTLHLLGLIVLSASILPALQQRGVGPGPWNNDIDVYHVRADQRAERLATFPRAGVSTLARLADGRLIAAHQQFPESPDRDFDTVAVRFSRDEGRTWTEPRTIELTNRPAGMRFPFDPTLVLLPDGRMRLYFTSRREGTADLPAIYSALSQDGIVYDWEPGVRFAIPDRPVIDSAVTLHAGVFHLFAPDNGPAPSPGSGLPPVGRGPDGAGYHATSTDGLTFERRPDVRVDGRRQWLGAAHSDGTRMTFFGSGDGIWTATSRDGETWALDARLAVPGADPGAVRAAGGDGWLVSVTSPPRRGVR